jgi:GNAT superfamily N-acetyltransferase
MPEEASTDPPAAATPTIRDASADDLPCLTAFNQALAVETESKQLDARTVERGVASALQEPDRLRYWVAESGGRVVGQAAVTREWSDWRNGWIWWLQSVYVPLEHRGQGVFRLLFEHIRREAQERGNVIGLRLYVETENKRARQVYETLGMKPGGYLVFEEIWGGGITRAPG